MPVWCQGRHDPASDIRIRGQQLGDPAGYEPGKVERGSPGLPVLQRVGAIEKAVQRRRYPTVTVVRHVVAVGIAAERIFERDGAKDDTRPVEDEPRVLSGR